MTDPDWTQATEPWGLFDDWYALAEQHEPDVPNAMQLATADASGHPSVRTVLLKGVSRAGFDFYTNLSSRKGRELGENPRAALVFHWKSIRRQVLVRGTIARTPDEVADAYWATRARGKQIAAWASAQSRPIPEPGAYARAVDEIEARFTDQTVPRPPFWSGFRLIPNAIEFWLDGESRMHTRVELSREDPTSERWSTSRLFP